MTKANFDDNVAVQIEIIQKSIDSWSVYLNHKPHRAQAQRLIDEENRKLDEYKEKYPEYFL